MTCSIPAALLHAWPTQGQPRDSWFECDICHHFTIDRDCLWKLAKSNLIYHYHIVSGGYRPTYSFRLQILRLWVHPLVYWCICCKSHASWLFVRRLGAKQTRVLDVARHEQRNEDGCPTPSDTIFKHREMLWGYDAVSDLVVIPFPRRSEIQDQWIWVLRVGHDC